MREVRLGVLRGCCRHLVDVWRCRDGCKARKRLAVAILWLRLLVVLLDHTCGVLLFVVPVDLFLVRALTAVELALVSELRLAVEMDMVVQLMLVVELRRAIELAFAAEAVVVG